MCFFLSLNLFLLCRNVKISWQLVTKWHFVGFMLGCVCYNHGNKKDQGVNYIFHIIRIYWNCIWPRNILSVFCRFHRTFWNILRNSKGILLPVYKLWVGKPLWLFISKIHPISVTPLTGVHYKNIKLSRHTNNVNGKVALLLG